LLVVIWVFCCGCCLAGLNCNGHDFGIWDVVFWKDLKFTNLLNNYGNVYSFWCGAGVDGGCGY
jgi:hypothetical protein